MKTNGDQMSEDKSTSGANSEGSANTEKKDSVSYDSFSKLLGEKKKLQSDAESLRAKLAEIEQGKLEAEGKVKEALENQKKMTEQYKSKNVEIIKTVSNKAVKSQFLREAEKLGCIDSELAMKACTFDDLEITDDFEFDNQKLIGKIQELTKTKPHLFKKDFKMPDNMNPNNKKESKTNLAGKTPEELIALYKQQLAGNS